MYQEIEIIILEVSDLWGGNIGMNLEDICINVENWIDSA